METYGLIGYPLHHSFSKKFFNEKFLKEKIDAEYVNFELPDISLFPSILSNTPNTLIKGLNVTIPYKESIIEYLDEIDPLAAKIGAVNVIKIIRSNNEEVILKGYNTDIIGFEASIKPFIESKTHKKALVLGTGGAAKAVTEGLKDLGLATTNVSRNPIEGQLHYDQINEDIINEYMVIINSSPLGTFPNVNQMPNIPYCLLTPKHLLYDLVYNPAETKFLQLGKEMGAMTKNGAEMLELQALAAWDIWNS